MEYEILGDNLPVVVCNLEDGESVISEGGGMSWMSPNMKMETTTRGGVGKAFGRMFSGEKMFQNRYTAKNGPGMIAFASSFPGSIMTFNISQNKDIIAQKRAFLACEEGVELSVFFNKKISGGFFGGEGFIMQRLSGEGLAFIEIDGHAIEYTLEEGQSIVVDTGHLATMDSTCSLEVKSVPGVKNILFGGEGLFNTIVTGPGRVILQSMPLSNIAGAIGSVLPSSN
ncbi:TIGR00266 family protein [Miniphocaeibacter halophilus]|uniref:TIGR00266 family protein n=1 Tax=Miniphocaeibacter halophilus TaxID=2931922 RepID=A0AC61MZZ7_9FIRM|nr:TIGR00266 family protein [Miniphocaeibacter halophilus]QQK08629.1 TIGR00266 family protein [Miniphocaeibacter halophilus]